MSWAEDEGIDAYDFEDLDKRSEDWDDGFHITRDGTKIRLKDLKLYHLKNIINYFSNCDTTMLEEELEERS